MNSYVLQRIFPRLLHKPLFQEVLLRYAQALLTQIGRTAVCNMRHTIT